MAKPIRATPTLVGEKAVSFVESMRLKDKNLRLTNTDKEFIKIIQRNKKIFTV